MKSRFCYTTAINNTFYFSKSVENQANESFNFSSSFWQPFIDVTIDDGNAILCGPLMEIMIHFADLMQMRLIY